MDLLTGLLFFLSFLGALAVKLIIAEAQDWIPTLARRLIDHAAGQLPKSEQVRFREEWYSHLDECPGKLSKLWHAIGCAYGARAIAFVVSEAPRAQPNQQRTVRVARSTYTLSRAEGARFKLVISGDEQLFHPDLIDYLFRDQQGRAYYIELKGASKLDRKTKYAVEELLERFLAEDAKRSSKDRR
jgi:hypothetical protein